ncbi:MAG: hypothetical protein RL667_1306, partial [Pseudomonadota bacterium]
KSFIIKSLEYAVVGYLKVATAAYLEMSQKATSFNKLQEGF